MLRVLAGFTIVLGLFSCAKKGSDTQPVPDESLDTSGFWLGAGESFLVKPTWKLPLICCDDGEQEVTLEFLKGDSSVPQTVVINEFHPRMPKMGHGTDESTQSFEATDQPNVLKVTGIYFNMEGEPGGWVVTMIVTVDGVTDSIELPLPRVGS